MGIFSCPRSSRPTLVTYSLTNVYVIVLDSKPSRPNPQPRKSDGGHEKTWPNQQKDNDKDKYKDNDNEIWQIHLENTFKVQSLRLLIFETFHQSDEKTCPNQQKDKDKDKDNEKTK